MSWPVHTQTHTHTYTQTQTQTQTHTDTDTQTRIIGSKVEISSNMNIDTNSEPMKTSMHVVYVEKERVRGIPPPSVGSYFIPQE